MTVLFRNTFFMLMFNLFGRASGLVRYLVCTKLLSDEAWGIVYWALNFSGIARIFIDGGLDNLVTRDGARHKSMLPTYAVTALAIKLALSGLFFLGTIFFLPLLGVTQEGFIATLAGVITITWLSLTGVLRSAFSALERMEYVFYTHGPCRITALAVTLGALLIGLTPWAIVVCIFSENIIWFGLSLFFIHRFFRLTDGTCSFSSALKMLNESWPLALYGFFNVLYLKMDILMLQWLTGTEEVGTYGYSQYLVEGVTLVVSGYIVAVFPIFSRLYGKDEARFRELYTQSLAVMMALTITAAVGLGGFADVWPRLLPKGGGSMDVLLPILAWTMISAIGNSFLISIFTARDRQRWLVVFLLLTVAVSFTSNYVLILHYHQTGEAYLGAGVASLVSQYALFVLMLLVLRFRMQLKPPLGRWAMTLICSLAALGSARSLPDWLWLAGPVVFALLTPLALLVFRVVGWDDIRLFRTITVEVEE